MSLYVLAKPGVGGRHRGTPGKDRFSRGRWSGPYTLIAAAVAYVGLLATFSAYASAVIR